MPKHSLEVLLKEHRRLQTQIRTVEQRLFELKSGKKPRPAAPRTTKPIAARR